MRAFSAPAVATAQVWRTILGAVLIAALYVALNYLLFFYLRDRYGGLIAGSILSAMVDGHTPAMMILLLTTFLTLAAPPVLIVRALNRRRAGTLFGPARRALADFRTAMFAGLAVSLAALPFSLAGTEPGLPLSTLVAWLPLALVGILIQTAAEELVFRGYLQQQLAARFRSPLIWIGVPTALFAWGHHAPWIYGGNALSVSLWAGAFGLVAADLTARTGTLGAAIGFHFANNVAAFLLVGIRGEMDGLALWVLPIDVRDAVAIQPLLLADLATMFITWLVIRIALRV